MSQFQLYLNVGFQHISDINGYDHIVFLIALCASYVLSQWRQLLILITAFTIGHSVTLALSTLNIVLIPSEIIEFFIPVTIFIMAISNMLRNDTLKKRNMNLHYGMALFFGLIHGMGFSNYLKALMGQEESIVMPLLAFNVGLELGQIMIVAIIMLITYVVVDQIKLPLKKWTVAVSAFVAIVALYLMWETKFW